MKSLNISQSVGSSGAVNSANDVKLVRSLLNVYLRQQKKTVLSITDKSDADLEQAIHDFQVDVVKSSKPDSRVDPRGKTFTKLNDILKKVFKPVSFQASTFGIVTWESEGAEGGLFHSRKLHVPSRFSGLTLGRGYDCSQKTQNKISTDLVKAGVPAKIVAIIKKFAGLTGTKAERIIIDNDLLDYQITHAMQKALFKISYDEEAKEVKRISNQQVNIKKYGSVDWVKLNPHIKDILVDLKYRGDYIPATRKFIQVAAANNDLAAFKKAIQDKSNWSNVPADRFKRRSDYIATAKTTTPKKAP